MTVTSKWLLATYDNPFILQAATYYAPYPVHDIVSTLVGSRLNMTLHARRTFGSIHWGTGWYGFPSVLLLNVFMTLF